MLLSPLNKGSHCPGLYLYFKTLSHPPPRAETIHMLLWKRASQGFLLRFGSSAKGSLHKGSAQCRTLSADVTATTYLHLTQDSPAKWCLPLFLQYVPVYVKERVPCVRVSVCVYACSWVV